MKLLNVVERGGKESYLKTLEFQEQLLQNKTADRSLNDTLVVVEHDHVYTTGRSVESQTLAGKKFAAVPWIEVGRGGQATYHGPGQLVCYPVFDLEQHGKDVHVFLRDLERVIIRTLKQFKIRAYTREGLTGVWVKQPTESEPQWRKISSIGIGVKRWVSYHGIALNVENDLSYFSAISACGMDGELATSIAGYCDAAGLESPSFDEVKEAMVDSFQHVFSLTLDAQYESTTSSGRPRWLKAKAPGSPGFLETNDMIRDLNLVTVCEEARCPNIGECWSHHTATFMVMGEACTRRCSFCSVKDGTVGELDPLDPYEPLRVGKAVADLGLEHVVITSVNRDDLEDMGAEHFNKVAKAIRHSAPNCNIEFLIPDMRGRRELVEATLASNLISVLNHNVETVPRLYKDVRPGAVFQRSLDILRWAKEICPEVKTKSGLMVGLGEKKDEVLEVMDALRGAGVDILTIGQYLQPTMKQLAVKRFVTPEEFADYKSEGEARGFGFVESDPLVRSSYHAWKHAEGASA